LAAYTAAGRTLKKEEIDLENAFHLAETQSLLAYAGLDISLQISEAEETFIGMLDGKPVTMTVSRKNERDGIREYLVLTLFGQDEEKAIPKFSRFMGYPPYCRYSLELNEIPSLNYEWNRINPEIQMGILEKKSELRDLQRLEEGFKNPLTPKMGEHYMQFSLEGLNNWEKAAQQNPDADWNDNRIADFLPFMRKAMPRIATNQSMFGLSIISLEGYLANEEEIVRYGLQPILAAGILTEGEADQIVAWYLRTKPTQDSGGLPHFRKEFEIDGTRYRLMTDSIRYCRDLNLVKPI
jgi:hypothetical protein